MSVLTPVEEDSLMTSDDLRDQEAWDREFQRRREDLARQQLKSRERRRAVSKKMAELQGRWKGVERKRQLASRENKNSNSSHDIRAPADQTTNDSARPVDANNNSSNNNNISDNNNTNDSGDNNLER